MSTHLDVNLLMGNLSDYVECISAEEEQALQQRRQAYIERFLASYGLIHNSGRDGFFETLEYQKISYEDLDWLEGEINNIPDLESGEPILRPDKEDYFRDQALTKLDNGILVVYAFMPGFNDVIAIRKAEDYF